MLETLASVIRFLDFAWTPRPSVGTDLAGELLAVITQYLLKLIPRSTFLNL